MKINPNIVFKQIVINNLFCFRELEFDFEKFYGMNLITGINNDIKNVKNGSGKSSFISAIFLALYGKTPKNINNSYLVFRQNINEPGFTKITFEVNGKIYVIVTTIEYNKSSKCQLFENGINISKASIKDTRLFIENEILKIPPNIFLQTVLLSEKTTNNFFTLTKHEKKIFKEELFDLTIFGEMYNLIHKDNLNLNTEITTNQEKLKLLENTIDDLVTHSEKCKTDSKNLIKKFKDEIKEKQSKKFSLLKVENEELFNKRLAILEEKKNQFQLKEYELKNKITRLDSSISFEKKQKDNIIKYNNKFSSILDIVCDDCKNNIADKYSINDNKSQLNEIESNIINKHNEIKQIEEQNKELGSKLKKAIALIKDIEAINLDLRYLSKQLKNALNEKETPFKKLIDDNSKLKDNIKNELEEKILEKYYLSHLEELISDEGIKKYIIKDSIKIVNERLKYYLSKLGANYICTCDADFNFTFLTDSGETSYNTFSSGEMARINIATLFAFKDLLSVHSMTLTNLLFIDEFLDSSLDEYAINAILEILRENLNEKQLGIFIVSHRPEILSKIEEDSIFENVIKFEKTNGESSISTI